MDIYQAEGTLVCTSRVPGLKQTNLRILRGLKGNLVVATDVVGVDKETGFLLSVVQQLVMRQGTLKFLLT